MNSSYQAFECIEFDPEDVAVLGPPYSNILHIDDLEELKRFIIQSFELQDPMWYIADIRR